MAGAEPNHREGAAGERAELPECSEPEVPAEPEVQPELRLAAAGEELPEPSAQEEQPEHPQREGAAEPQVLQEQAEQSVHWCLQRIAACRW